MVDKFHRYVWLTLATLLSAACAALAPPPEELVRQRAQARWDALVAGEWGKAYRYMSPSYRALVEEKRFAGQFGTGAAIVGTEVVRVTCEGGERCIVRIKARFRPVVGGRTGETLETHFDETWIREDGQWWMSQRP